MIRQLLTVGLLLANFDASAHENSTQDTAMKDEVAIKHIINRIEYGWENGDGTPFKKHFLDFRGARYFESGGQNIGLNDLVDHHVEPEKDALAYLNIEYNNVVIHVENDFAWALSDTLIKGEVKSSGKEFDKKGFQTFLFRKIGGKWKVVHTHSSSRNRVEK